VNKSYSKRKHSISIAFLAIVYALTWSPAIAADGDYPVWKIPANLTKGANAVVRLEEMRFEIINTGRTATTHHYVLTILNENGDKWAEFVEWYDKSREIESVEGILYDANGKQLKKVKRKDLEDLSGVSDGSLMDDNRIKRHNFYYKVYPYTIEYTVEMSDKATLFFPTWNPRGGENLSVEKSSMSIVCSPEYQFRYKAFLYEKAPVITQEKSNKVSTWSASNLQAISRETFSPMWHELSTYVMFGPTNFQVDDYKGNMMSWQDFGKFVHSLRQGRDNLPEEIKQKVHQLTDGITDPVQKVSALYKFMQGHTRYVSIQLGIGGWQPFDASFVASKKYGDCKALTNYMYSILKEAGMPSYYTLVKAGRTSNYITEDFPSQQFNHVILCVPMKKDTMWLECTSQTQQAGYLGDFTSDRPALLIDESGGKLVRTPKYSINDNLQIRKITATLTDNGSLNVKAATWYTGLQQDNIHGLITYLSKDKVKEHLQERLDFATYDILKFNYQEEKKSLPAISESLDITVSNYATVTGKRLFIVPNVMTRDHRKLGKDTARKYDFQLGMEYRDVDTVEIEIPKGYAVETKPQDVSVNTPFGKYACSVKLVDNKLYYYRNLEYNAGRHPATKYNEFAGFIETIYKSDRNRVVLVKNETALKAF
jgi:hypothetical protein